MFRLFVWLLLFFALAVLAGVLWALLRPTILARRVERARRQFIRDRDALEMMFFRAAAASGKPRGLSWKSCAFHNAVLLAHDRSQGKLVGLLGVTVGFEAVEGGGMEDVEAVGNLRAATAVFTYNGREWTTNGRVLFNLEPREVLQRYGSLVPLR